MSVSNILTIVGLGISFLSLLLSIVLKRKNPQLAKTFEEISQEALEFGNMKANKYLVKQCKKYKIDLADKSINCEQSNTIYDADLSSNIKVGG
jgi:hypothetical protein